MNLKSILKKTTAVLAVATVGSVAYDKGRAEGVKTPIEVLSVENAAEAITDAIESVGEVVNNG